MLAVSGIASGDGGRPLEAEADTAQPLTVDHGFQTGNGRVEARAVAHLKESSNPWSPWLWSTVLTSDEVESTGLDAIFKCCLPGPEEG